MGVEGVEVNKVAKTITDLDEIENINIIHGDYDLIALVKAKTLISLKETVVEKIRNVKGIAKVATLIIADEEQ